MPKHYANKRLTKLDSIFDQINIPNDDTTTKDSQTSSRPSQRGEADTDSSSTSTT
jgi:hypothetical protein